MPRRKNRDNDFDDSLERSYVMSRQKRSKTEDNITSQRNDKDDPAKGNSMKESQSSSKQPVQKKQQEASSPSTPRTSAQQTQKHQKESSGSASSIDRLREKKRHRKEKNKAKAEERRRQMQEKQAKEGAEKKKKQQQQQQKRKQQQTNKQNKPDGQLVTAHKGVQYQDIIIGTGPEVRMGKQIQVKYTLRASPGHRGRVIDSSHNFGTRLGRGEVIEGWDIGLKGMKRGGLRHLIVPPQAGYGKHKNIGAGKGSLLYFEIRLLAC